ncbi:MULTISPECIES: single-stranded DNA-binding protein [unclassified Streptomyces]|uniref:single-stranded DNA-binding protein n=1 Tax=unclassified Streptomyces TaxID=2593676 RepID=UPI00165663B7|nr:single-stranded DNA-binding protein [Streptomyces sp. CB02980]MCB8905254.1 single-stranded DNA-binding protein [Streptomyces sp. CB02980]
MNDTTVTLVGNVATAVEYRDTATGGVARFRFAVTARRWDREKGLWSDGPTSFYTVSAWRSLGANLAASVSVGEPLVVHGRLRVREDERDGQRKTFVDVAALAVGHDLSRGTAAFRRAARPLRAESEPGTWPGAGPEAGPGADPGAGPGAGPWAEPQVGAAERVPALGPAPDRDPWAVAAEEAAAESTTRLVTVP